MKKIIVLGATGQLGCYSALHLASLGYHVVAVGHRNNDNGFFDTKGIHYIGGLSIEKEECLKMLPTDVDAVVNLAGAMPAHSGTTPMPYIQSIIVGMVNLCEWMKDTKCRRIVFNTTPSDIAAFFGSNVPVMDDAPRSFPKDGGDHAIYAIAKNTALDILEHYCIAYGIKSCIFRHLTVYGYQPNPYYILSGLKKMLPWRYIVLQAIKGNRIEVWGDHSRLKELLYIKDFAEAVALAIDSDCTGILNLGGDRPYTLDEQIQGIIDVFCHPNNISEKVYCPEMPDTPQNLLESTKARTVLRWTPKYSWIEACKDIKKEMMNEPMSRLWGKSIDYE